MECKPVAYQNWRDWERFRTVKLVKFTVMQQLVVALD
nr:MAG TPA: hypothetical protein [Caudoviricetes sp.]